MLRILVRRDVLSHTNLFLRQAPAPFDWNYAAGACAQSDKQGRATHYFCNPTQFAVLN